jgi:hypothetical protein
MEDSREKPSVHWKPQRRQDGQTTLCEFAVQVRLFVAALVQKASMEVSEEMERQVQAVAQFERTKQSIFEEKERVGQVWPELWPHRRKFQPRS